MAINVNNSNAQSSGRGMSPAEIVAAAQARYGAPPPLTSQQQVPARDAASEAVMGLVPMLLEYPEYSGPTEIMDDQLSESSTPQDLARVSQSGLAGRERMEPVFGADGQPMINPDGSYQQRPVGMGAYAGERAEQLTGVADYRDALTAAAPTFDEYGNIDPGDTVGFTRNVMLNDVATGNPQSKLVQAKPTAEKLEGWADTAGNVLNLVAADTNSNLFNFHNSTFKSAKPGFEGMPIGLRVAYENGMPDEQSVNTMGLLIGAATAIGAGQATLFRPDFDDTSVIPVDSSSNPMQDYRTFADLSNSIQHAARNAFDKAGIKLSAEDLREMVYAQVQSEIEKGGFIKSRDKSGRVVYAASQKWKNRASELAYLSESLAGDTRRTGPSSTPQIGGSNFIKPGSQLSANSLPGPNVTMAVADMVKDLMGSVMYEYRPKDVMFTRLMVDELLSDTHTDPETGQIQWSNSPFAKRYRVSQADFDGLRMSVKPKEGYTADAEQVKALEGARTAHATSEINNKINQLKYDVSQAEAIKGGFYIAHSHSIANQRFIEMTRGADSMSSKAGVREMRNFVKQDNVRAAALFDEREIEQIKGKGMVLLRKVGKDRQAAHYNMTPADTGAIAAMIASVVNYYSVAAPNPTIINKSIVKYSEAQLLGMYTPEIGMRMAALGDLYNNFLMAPTEGDHAEIKSYLAGMPRGEALGNKNLWDDMSQLYQMSKDPTSKNKHLRMSYINFDDGNQNGIYIQSLFFGNDAVSARLGSYNPNLGDMRALAGNIIGEKIEDIMKDQPEKLNAWKTYFAEAAKEDGFLSDLFKKPLMQNAYSMHASMFGNHVLDTITSGDYYPLFEKHLMKEYSDGSGAANDLNVALEATLNHVVDQASPRMLMNIGRMASVLGYPISYKNIDGDTAQIAPVSMAPEYDPALDTNTGATDPENGDYLVKHKGLKMVNLRTNSGEYVSMPAYSRQINPNFTKGTVSYYDKRSDSLTSFDNAIGSAQARMAAVMPIQSADAALVKLTMLAVNSGNKSKITEPVSFVHDAINAPGSASLLYRNAYNNIAIPQAIPEIAKFAKQLDAGLKEAFAKAKQDVDKMGYVGIGANGDYPSLGALLDEAALKIRDDGQYKPVFLRMNKYDVNSKTVDPKLKAAALEAWSDYKARTQAILDEAKSNGWKPPGVLNEEASANLAVKASQFHNLVAIAAELLGIAGTKSRYKQWVDAFGTKVTNSFNTVSSDPRVKSYGIAQMTTSGGGKVVNYSKYQQEKDNKRDANYVDNYTRSFGE